MTPSAETAANTGDKKTELNKQLIDNLKAELDKVKADLSAELDKVERAKANKISIGNERPAPRSSEFGSCYLLSAT